MSDLTILIFITLLLATFMFYFMAMHWIHLRSLERIGIYKPVKKMILLSASFIAPLSIGVFILAIAGLI